MKTHVENSDIVSVGPEMIHFRKELLFEVLILLECNNCSSASLNKEFQFERGWCLLAKVDVIPCNIRLKRPHAVTRSTLETKEAIFGTVATLEFAE